MSRVWKRFLKTETADFFLETILEIPPEHVASKHIDYEPELSGLINEFGDDITEDVFIEIARIVAEANAVDYESVAEWNEQYDESTGMYIEQKEGYEEAISMLMDELYRIRVEREPEPEPEPKPEPPTKRSKVHPNTGDWKKNLKIIQRERKRKKAAQGSNARRSRFATAGGQARYGGALVGNPKSLRGIDTGTFQCVQCQHTRSNRNRKLTDSGEKICDYCVNSNRTADARGKSREGSGGYKGFNIGRTSKTRTQRVDEKRRIEGDT